MEDRADIAAPSPVQRPARAARSRRWLALGMFVMLLAAATLGAVLLVREHGANPAPAVRRGDPVVDLLGWIPATAETRRAFAVWSPDPGGISTPEAITANDPLIRQLALTPRPATLGRSPGWRGRFGYSAHDVTSWATAGPNAALAVLGGNFDLPTVERRLTDAGYRRSLYHGVPLYTLHDTATPSIAVEGDVVSAANAVALFEGRLITSASPQMVRAAIDAAQGRAPSLADDGAIAALLRTLAPLNGIVAVDAADHAIDCGVSGPWTRRTIRTPTGRYVVVGYGRLGVGGPRRTLVATTFADEAAASEAHADYETGWHTGVANAAGAGAAISVFGQLSAVSRTGAILVAELLDGREDGWVRAGIRFAIPVCEAASTALPPGTPVPPATDSAPSGLSRVLDSLPDIGTDGSFLVADLAAIAQARGIAPPENAAAVGAWLEALAPLPDFSAFPLDSEQLARWPITFGVPLDSIRAIGEARPALASETVAVLVGDWDPEIVKIALGRLGYASIELGPATHFSLGAFADLAEHPATLAGGTMWHNVAVIGDRIFLSSSIRALREAVDAAIGYGPAPTPASGIISFHDRLLLVVPDATAAEVTGATVVWRRCAGQATVKEPDWLGLAAIWSARPDGDTAAIAVVPFGDAPLSVIVADIDAQLRQARLGNPPGTPGPGVPLADKLGYVGVERHDAPNLPTVIIARFVVPPNVPSVSGFFAATAGGCAFGVLP